MSLKEKAALLSGGGRWDSCGCDCAESKGVYGSIYNSSTEAGSVPVFKTLLTNACGCDCRYCENSAYCRRTRVAYEPAELAKVFLNLHNQGIVWGLFLSSGIAGDADSTTEKMLAAVRLIRGGGFRGYVHFKILPGASRELVRQASEVADRLSINIEAPGSSRLAELSTVKNFDSDIIKRQKWIREFKPRAGQTTQMVVGAGDETDLEVLRTAVWEYKEIGLSRVYYSAFTPLQGTPLEARAAERPERERRLYSSDYLMRDYGIRLRELEGIMDGGNLPAGDPKTHLANQQLDAPVDANEAEYEELIRVPGIGPKTALRVILAREVEKITKPRQLHHAGADVKKARPYLKIDGKKQKKVTEY